MDMYVSLTRICHTLVTEIRVSPEMLQNIVMLTCVIYNWNSKDDRYSLPAMKIIDKDS